MTLRTFAPDVFLAEAPQRFFGLEVGARMTVLRLGDDLLVHSPIAMDPGVASDLGTVRWVLAPNRMHHLHAGPWIAGGAEGWAAPGLPDKRPDVAWTAVVDERGEPWGPDVLAVPLTSIALTNEVVLLHRPSRTLVVTDFFFHFGPDAPWLTRTVLRAGGGYPGPRVTLLEKLAMQRDAGRADVEALLELDFDRVVMAHGDPIEAGGRDALRAAFAWLL